VSNYTGVFITLAIGWTCFVAGLGAWVADKKGYSMISWFFMCLITGIFGLIAIAGVPSKEIEFALDEIKRKLDANNSSAAPSLSEKESGQSKD